ncbi:DPY30 domain-containing protein 1-like [Amphibalanus amphitrite]|uniref:DPY30 domain-containing protein 1-like n=1 Tax=Amphibalanus amphitrite TaxID=1232801 RepID=UPI001C90BA5D|nr:DPY30 domain-containing protein 1-like [Amphibalanus amphitrite]XP_043204075.1 DPY30 domain-containing protein 1-like [Amphibalanus amphitrite]
MPLEDAEALSAESGYLQEKLGVALTCGLAEVCRRRPSDPIQFLAQWLLRFRHFSQEALDLELAELQRAEEQQRLAQYEYTALMQRRAAEEAEDNA